VSNKRITSAASHAVSSSSSNYQIAVSTVRNGKRYAIVLRMQLMKTVPDAAWEAEISGPSALCDPQMMMQ
jgi:hypothetical protein